MDKTFWRNYLKDLTTESISFDDVFLSAVFFSIAMISLLRVKMIIEKHVFIILLLTVFVIAVTYWIIRWFQSSLKFFKEFKYIKILNPENKNRIKLELKVNPTKPIQDNFLDVLIYLKEENENLDKKIDVLEKRIQFMEKNSPAIITLYAVFLAIVLYLLQSIQAP